MGAENLASDVMMVISSLSPFWLLFGGIAFADITLSFLVRLVKAGKIKW